MKFSEKIQSRWVIKKGFKGAKQSLKISRIFKQGAGEATEEPD